MIVTVGRVTTDAQRREELMRVGQAVARASRADDGCIAYRIYQDTENPDEFVFVEEWESEEALRSHFATPHVAEFMQAISATLASPPDVKFHTVASSLDLADVGASA
ncbi:MAG TPA: putative quinol monooxygenase [Solirubrobacteraceae bacterium]|jgi:quinol monooxygenase YgiN|nr:putative quinol monooxygenase [Solirubrobacteraceae bacterium]